MANEDAVEDFEFLLFGDDDGDGGGSSGDDDDDDDEDEEGGNADDDFEFLLGAQDGRPPIHNQEGDTCVFHAITFAAEMEMRRRVPTTDITFNAASFAADYEREIGMNLGDQAAAGIFPFYHREATGLQLFRRDGVLARSAAWEGERRLRISSYRVHRNVDDRPVRFSEVAQLILDGRPVIGIMRVSPMFLGLGPGEIFDHMDAAAEPPQEEDAAIHTHAVAFIGFGVRGGRHYLVLANSAGPGFGDDGLGRVYFSSVYDDRFYTLKATPPADQDHPSLAASAGPPPPRFSHIGSSSSGAAHGFFTDTVGSSSSTAPSSSRGGAAQRFFDVGSTSSATPPTPFFDDGSTGFSALFSSPSGIQSFINDDLAFSPSTLATHHNSSNGRSSSSTSATESFFVGSTASSLTFDDGSSTVVATGPTSSSTAPTSSSAGPASSSTAPSSSSLPDE